MVNVQDPLLHVGFVLRLILNITVAVLAQRWLHVQLFSLKDPHGPLVTVFTVMSITSAVLHWYMLFERDRISALIIDLISVGLFLIDSWMQRIYYGISIVKIISGSGVISIHAGTHQAMLAAVWLIPVLCCIGTSSMILNDYTQIKYGGTSAIMSNQPLNESTFVPSWNPTRPITILAVLLGLGLTYSIQLYLFRVAFSKLRYKRQQRRLLMQVLASFLLTLALNGFAMIAVFVSNDYTSQLFYCASELGSPLGLLLPVALRAVGPKLPPALKFLDASVVTAAKEENQTEGVVNAVSIRSAPYYL